MNQVTRWAVTTLAFITLALPVQADSNQQAINIRHIEVSGQGLVNETPDIALLTLTFSQRDKQARRAKSTVDSQVDDLLTLTQQLGIKKKDLQAARLTIYPEYDHKNNRQLIGYRVSRDVQIKLRDLLNYPKLLEGAVDIGASNTGQLQLDFSNRKELENKALQAAFHDAKQQAELLAQASGDTLGKTLWIHTSGSHRPVPQMRMAMMSDMKAEASYPTGEMSLSRQIQVRFSLQN